MKSERIKELRKKHGFTQQRLGELIGVKKSSISQWENGEHSPSGDNLAQLSRVFGVAAHWLSTGKGTPEPSNVETAAIPQGNRVPILSYVQAGNWREMCEQASAADGSLEYTTAAASVSGCAFALWVRGNSMEPEFREGELLIIDPEAAPSAGDYVIAKNGHEEATFKKYRSRGEYPDGRPRFELVPLNEDHATLSTDQGVIAIIGVVVEHRRIFKRGNIKER